MYKFATVMLLNLETNRVQLTIPGDRNKQSGFCINAIRFPLLLSSRDYPMTESSSASRNGCPRDERIE